MERAAYRGQVTRLVNAINEYLRSEESKPDKNKHELDSIEEELTSYMERLKLAQENLRRANEEMKVLLKPEEAKSEFEKITEYEDNAVNAIARLKVRLAKVNRLQEPVEQPAEPRSEKQNVIKLPKLQLRKFSGDLREWLPFWEQFKTAVHDNTTLSTVDKFNYLLSVLTGKAANVVAGFTPTQGCYESAIALLAEEYGDRDKIIDGTMQQLMSLKPVISKNDAKGLRGLYNSVMAGTRSLTALGIPSSHYYIMLKTILLRCLPNDLRVEFHRYYSGGLKRLEAGEDEPEVTLNDSESSIEFEGDKQTKALLKFLKKEVSSLERSIEIRGQTGSSHSKSFSTAANLFTTAVKEPCFFCKSSCHRTDDCDAAASIGERKQMLLKEGRCFRCARRGHLKKFCKIVNLKCNNCKGRHMTSMCDPTFKKSGFSVETKVNKQQPSALNLYAANFEPRQMKIYLQTACVYASAKKVQSGLFVRLVLDGGSQLSFVRKKIATALNLPVIGTKQLSVIPFGESSKPPAKQYEIVRMYLKGQYNDKVLFLDTIVVPEICIDVLATADYRDHNYHQLKLADVCMDNACMEQGISILIGADQYWKFATGEIKRISENLTAINTEFGWTLQGPAESYSSNLSSAVIMHMSFINDFDFRNFWRLEAIGINKEDEVADDFTANFKEKSIHLRKDRYEVNLPWRSSIESFDNNRHGAWMRLQSLLRKLSKEPMRLLEYDAAMREYIDNEVAEEVEEHTSSQKEYYLPHRPVYRDDKITTKLRIVFDASAHANEALSLNDQLEKGSNLLPDLLKIILNFRLGRIGLTADIEKAFLQIALARDDRDSHRFFWFTNRIRSIGNLPELQSYRMTRVTFGVTCSPFLLSATIQKHLESEEINYPESCAILRDCFYVDDLVASVDDEAACERLYKQASLIMRKAAMNLRKWNCSNSSCRNLMSGANESPLTQKVLGIQWNVHLDEISVDLESVENFLKSLARGTKRNLLQLIARIYDPIGLLGPYVISLKILFQSAWRLGLQWDEELPNDLLSTWQEACDCLHHLREVVVPRCVSGVLHPKYQEIHIFADASPKAYGCAAYLRSTSETQLVAVRFLCAKSRVSPLKEDGPTDVTIPRLELTAALIAARLCEYLRNKLKINFPTYLWTDSKITLYWIRGKAEKWKQYVTNRVREIHSLVRIDQWRYCPGNENPADLITRGLTGKQLTKRTLWLNGPGWLQEPSNNWPVQDFECENLILVNQVEAEPQVSETNNVIESLLSFVDYSDWKKLLRVTAYTLRFIEHTKTRKRRESIHLMTEELEKAERYWIKYVQREIYYEELQALSSGQNLKTSSNILTLSPYIDSEGILRVGSRLRFASEDINIHSPIILPKCSHLSQLIARDLHIRTMHGGVNIVLCRIREKYWIPKGRQLVKTIVGQCVLCRKMKSKPISQPFAPLPRDRVISTRPFETTGTDFAGPLYTKSSNENTSRKCYIMLFTCAAVRAVHLELLPDLTTKSCLMGLRCFIARRGAPRTIYSDNARTFKRASKELSNLSKFVAGEELNDFLSGKGITWKYIVERAPWWGGFWERLVRSVKTCLKMTIGRATLDEEELRTLLTEVEGIVNSRPLTYVSEDPLDLNPLSPAHFLIGGPSFMISPEAELRGSNDIRRAWTERLKSVNFFWNRWKIEYLHQLRSAHNTPRSFSSHIKTGDIVQVYDPLVRRQYWKLAVVTKVYPGRDNKIRACEIRFNDRKLMRRPVQLLYPLEIN